MGKQVTVLASVYGSIFTLPTTALYTAGNVVTLSDVQYAELPTAYLQRGYISAPTDVADPMISSVSTSSAGVSGGTVAAPGALIEIKQSADPENADASYVPAPGEIVYFGPGPAPYNVPKDLIVGDGVTTLGQLASSPMITTGIVYASYSGAFATPLTDNTGSNGLSEANGSITIQVSSGGAYLLNTASTSINIFEQTYPGVPFTVSTLVLQQDSTGGRTVTWSSVLFAGGIKPVLSTAPNAIDVLTFTWVWVAAYSLFPVCTGFFKGVV